MNLLREISRLGRRAEGLVRQGKAAVRAVEHGAEGAAELARSMGAAATAIRDVSRVADKALCDAERLVGARREDPRVEVRAAASTPKPARPARAKAAPAEEVVDAVVEVDAPRRR